jgi:hypothetical protein
MRARYVFRNDQFVERKTGEPMAAPDRIATPFVLSDVTYKSPLSGKEITSRSQRREEMKIHGVREVDPGEFRPVYRQRKNAERMRGDHDPNAGALPAERMPGGEHYKRLSRDDLPEKLRKSIGRTA